jgi:hypothetical protein
MALACAALAGCAGGAPMPTAVITPVVQSTLPEEPTGCSTSLIVPRSCADEIPAAHAKTIMTIITKAADLLKNMLTLLRFICLD